MCIRDRYMTTGRTEAAMDILSRLRFHSPDNFIYSYKLAQCLMECGDNEGAHYLFNIVYNKNPEFQKTAYYLVQASIDSGELVDAEQELEKAEEYLSPHYAEYLQGQILEMKEKYEKAKDTYQAVSYTHLDVYKRQAFQFIMPVVGYYAGGLLAALITRYSGIVIFVTVSYLGRRDTMKTSECTAEAFLCIITIFHCNIQYLPIRGSKLISRERDVYKRQP